MKQKTKSSKVESKLARIEELKDDELIGKKLAEVLRLKVNKKTKRINTDWGIKSYIGLTATVRSILNGK